jgi:hypothetical protein
VKCAAATLLGQRLNLKRSIAVYNGSLSIMKVKERGEVRVGDVYTTTGGVSLNRLMSCRAKHFFVTVVRVARTNITGQAA